MDREISYNLDDYGTLRVYINGRIKAEVQDCGTTPNRELMNLIDEIVKE